MKSFARAVGVCAMLVAVAGCEFRHHGDDGVTRRFGSDYFGAGGSVNLTEAVAGDAFVAGGDATTAGEVRGDLLIAGGNVSVGGAVGDNLYAAGGDVRLDAIVGGNARLAGGDVRVGPATVVTGALTASGGHIRFDGTSHGDLQFNAGKVWIDGTVDGDAQLRAGEIDLGPQTRIAGKLIVYGESRPAVPAGAQIGGGIEFHELEAGVNFDDHDLADEARTVAHGVGSFLWVVGVFIAGTLFTLVFPAYSARAADWIGREPLRSLGLGFVVIVCLPILALLLLVTIVGIPLAVILVLLYLLLLFLGWVTAALFVGRKGLELFRGSQPVSTAWRLGALLLAVLALWLAGKLPVIGGWVTFVALLLGIGALVWQGWPRRSTPSAPAAPATASSAAPAGLA